MLWFLECKKCLTMTILIITLLNLQHILLLLIQFVIYFIEHYNSHIQLYNRDCHDIRLLPIKTVNAVVDRRLRWHRIQPLSQYPDNVMLDPEYVSPYLAIQAVRLGKSENRQKYWQRMQFLVDYTHLSASKSEWVHCRGNSEHSFDLSMIDCWIHVDHS